MYSGMIVGRCSHLAPVTTYWLTVTALSTPGPCTVNFAGYIQAKQQAANDRLSVIHSLSLSAVQPFRPIIHKLLLGVGGC